MGQKYGELNVNSFRAVKTTHPGIIHLGRGKTARYGTGQKTKELDKIEHIGIAVKNLKESNVLFEKLLGTASYKTEEVASEGVKTSFFKTGDSKIELLQAMNADSPIAKFLEKRGEGVHHIAFAVEDIVSEIARLKSEGFTVLNEEPKEGADNKWVAFLHPKSTNGVLVELCQER